MSTHEMPNSVILIGSQLGHLKVSPVAAPMLSTTPKPVSALNEPLPRIAKLRASPPITTPPIFTSAPTWPTCSSSCVPTAVVSRRMSPAISVSTPPISTRSVSRSNLNPSIWPFVKVSVARRASVSGELGRSLPGSAVRRSVMLAVKAPPFGKSFAPPLAMKIEPLKTSGFSASKLTEKFVTPTRMSSNSRMLPKRILPFAGAVPDTGCAGVGIVPEVGWTPPYCRMAWPIVKPF